VTKLGHIQRGGAPGVYDRLIASQLGVAAVNHLAAGESGLTLGIAHGKVTSSLLSTLAQAGKKPLDPDLVNLSQLLAQ
jgi:6-phosphofructokinase 1